MKISTEQYDLLLRAAGYIVAALDDMQELEESGVKYLKGPETEARKTLNRLNALIEKVEQEEE